MKRNSVYWWIPYAPSMNKNWRQEWFVYCCPLLNQPLRSKRHDKQSTRQVMGLGSCVAVVPCCTGAPALYGIIPGWAITGNLGRAERVCLFTPQVMHPIIGTNPLHALNRLYPGDVGFGLFSLKTGLSAEAAFNPWQCGYQSLFIFRSSLDVGSAIPAPANQSGLLIPCVAFALVWLGLCLPARRAFYHLGSPFVIRGIHPHSVYLWYLPHGFSQRLLNQNRRNLQNSLDQFCFLFCFFWISMLSHPLSFIRSFGHHMWHWYVENSI